jgi:hypothetical protein
MWNEVLPDVPKYLFRGKGYSFDPTEMDLADENARRGFGTQFSEALIVGDYHSGPLSVLIPLGLWGVLAFGWFMVACLRYLYYNYRHGDPELQRINLFLLTYFVARLVGFVFVFGALNYDLFVFTGLIGLSVSLNGARPVRAGARVAAESEVGYREEFASGELR